MLVKLERTLEEAIVVEKELPFPEFIRSLRLSIGLMQNKVAEFLCISSNRLKNLERGHFHGMPLEYEIVVLATFYDIKPSILEKKAREFVREKKKTKKTKISPSLSEMSKTKKKKRSLF
jgi:transcriptional regulator with XRE-family HTH domain